MHSNKFADFSPEEYQIAVETPMYVSLLISAADGEIAPQETEWAAKVTGFRIKTANYTLRDYYRDAHDYISKNMKWVLSELPENQEERMQYLSDKVARLNGALPKLDEVFRHRLVDSLRSLALSIAEIDGGVLGFFSDNPDEEKWLGLDMISE